MREEVCLLKLKEEARTVKNSNYTGMMETLEKTHHELKQFIDNMSLIKETFSAAAAAVEKAQLALNDLLCEQKTNSSELPECEEHLKPCMLNDASSINTSDEANILEKTCHSDKECSKDFATQNEAIEYKKDIVIEKEEVSCVESKKDENKEDSCAKQIEDENKETLCVKDLKDQSKEVLCVNKTENENKDIFGQVMSSLDKKGRFWFKPNGEENEEITLRRFKTWHNCSQKNRLDENAVKVDQIVAVKEKKTNSWMRAIIERIITNRTSGKQEVRLRYLDSGELDDVSRDDIYELHEELKHQPFLAMYCCLFDNIDEDLPYEAIWLFNDLKFEKQMRLQKRQKHTLDGKMVDLVDLWTAQDPPDDINYEILVKVKEHNFFAAERQSMECQTASRPNDSENRNKAPEHKYQRTKNPDVLTMRIGNDKNISKTNQAQNSDHSSSSSKQVVQQNSSANALEIARLHQILLQKTDQQFYVLCTLDRVLVNVIYQGRKCLKSKTANEFLDRNIDIIRQPTYIIFVRWNRIDQPVDERISAVAVVTSDLYPARQKNRYWINLDFISCSKLKAAWTLSKKNCFISRAEGIKCIEQVIHELSQGTATPVIDNQKSAVHREKQSVTRFPGQHSVLIPRFAKSAGISAFTENQPTCQDWDEKETQESNPAHLVSCKTEIKNKSHLPPQNDYTSAQESLVMEEAKSETIIKVIAANDSVNVQDVPQNEKDVFCKGRDSPLDRTLVNLEGEAVEKLESGIIKAVLMDSNHDRRPNILGGNSGDGIVKGLDGLVNEKKVESAEQKETELCNQKEVEKVNQKEANSSNKKEAEPVVESGKQEYEDIEVANEKEVKPISKKEVESVSQKEFEHFKEQETEEKAQTVNQKEVKPVNNKEAELPGQKEFEPANQKKPGKQEHVEQAKQQEAEAAKQNGLEPVNQKEAESARKTFEDRSNDGRLVNGRVKDEEKVNEDDQGILNGDSCSNEGKSNEIEGNGVSVNDEKVVYEEKPKKEEGLEQVPQEVAGQVPSEPNGVNGDDHNEKLDDLLLGEHIEDSVNCKSDPHEMSFEANEETIVHVGRKGSMHALIEKIELMFDNEESATENKTSKNAKDFLKNMKQNYARSLSSENNENDNSGISVGNDSSIPGLNESLLSEFSDDVSYTESCEAADELDKTVSDVKNSSELYETDEQQFSGTEKLGDMSSSFGEASSFQESEELNGKDSCDDVSAVKDKQTKKPDMQLYRAGKPRRKGSSSSLPESEKPQETVLNGGKNSPVQRQQNGESSAQQQNGESSGNSKPRKARKYKKKKWNSTGFMSSGDEKQKPVRILKRTDPDSVRLKAFKPGLE